MTRRIALAGWFGSDNLGDELILRALTVALRARGAEPVAISIDPEHTRRHHGISSISHRHPQQFPALVRALRGVDGLAIAGGIVQSETSPWNIPFHTSRVYAAAAAGCPAAAVGIGVGRVRGPVGRTLARRALRGLNSLIVRDADSAEQLRAWGLHGAAVGADPVAALAPGPVEPQDTMCVILRPPNRRGWRTSAAKSARFGDCDDADQMAQAIGTAAAASGLAPRFVAFQASRDDQRHQSVARRLQMEAEVVTPDLNNVLEEVGRSRLVITMRYHGAMAALLHGRPAVVLNYSPKMASLAAEGGGWAPLADPLRPGGDQLAAAVAAAFEMAYRAPEALGEIRSRLSTNAAALDALADTR